MFQKMAPNSAASTRILQPETTSGPTMPLPTVWATSVPKKAPTRLSDAAMNTAILGESTLVDTMVAMALAESCAPLVKSNTRAMATIARSSRGISSMFEHDPFENVA